MSDVYVGIDVGSTTCAAAVRDERGEILKEREFRTSESHLKGFVSQLEGDVRVLFEEGELAGWMYRLFLPLVKSVEVCDPKRNAWIAKEGDKGDPVDALKLSELLRLGSYKVVYHPADWNMANFKIVVQHHQQMVKTTTRIKNQIKSRLRQQGIIIKHKGLYTERGREKVIAMVECAPIQHILLQDFRLLDDAERERDNAEKLLIRESRNYPVIERLKKIPGVGHIGAARFVAYVQDPNRFNGSELCKFSKLAVVKPSSGGKPIGRQHLNYDGNGTLKDVSRKAFDGAVTRSRNHNGIKEYYHRSLQRTKKEDKARLNTQRKILNIMLAIWRDGTEYSDDIVNGKGA